MKITNKPFIQTQTKVELADVLGTHLSDYRKKYTLSPDQGKAAEAILACRTEKMGGQIELCNDCGYVHYMFNSCRNRHCPKCQTMSKEKWLEARKSELLPVKYFHAVFTLPHEINPVARCNKRVIYTILFKSATQTLKCFAQDPAHKLNGEISITTILHTWDQKLNHHIHLHCMVPGGALSADKKEWHGVKGDYLFPVKALSAVFRGKFMDMLKQAFADGSLQFPGKTEPLGTRHGFKQLTNQMWSKKWVVYAKEPFRSPEDVLEYIGRYTHRIAISNERIRSLQNNVVTFTYRDRKRKVKALCFLDTVEFIRRFLLHVLPSGYMRIRHYGITANRCKKENIRICKALLGVSDETPVSHDKTIRERMLELTGRDITLCPACGKGKLIVVAEIPDRYGVYRRKRKVRLECAGST